MRSRDIRGNIPPISYTATPQREELTLEQRYTILHISGEMCPILYIFWAGAECGLCDVHLDFLGKIVSS